MILLVFAFISGLVTILAPCIWPLLPIVFSSTATGGKNKPLGITLGIVLSFAIFTLSVSYLVKLFHFDPNVLRFLAVIVIAFLGLTLIIPALSAKLEVLISRLYSRFAPAGESKNGFTGGLVTGFSLGLVWSPCAGPILATIAALAITTSVNFQVVTVTLAYSLGVGIPLFFLSKASSLVFERTRFLNQYLGRIQQIFGVIMILTALAILGNYDKLIESKLLDVFPNYTRFITNIESNQAVTKELADLKTAQTNMNKPGNLPALGSAPEFVGITKWLNVDKPLTMADLRGKVILIDFWTYTCINCIRTLPHVTAWYDKYRDQGFVVIGVHTPEFEFEKDTQNVTAAIKQFGIHYPVAQDNNYGTWNAYGNQYWPAEYLIDAKGNIRHTHFGEGQYEETETTIQQLLTEAGNKVTTSVVSMPDQTPQAAISPETYVGSARMAYYYPSQNLSNGPKNLTLSPNLPPDTFSLGGTWIIGDEYSQTGQNAVLDYNFTAGKVFLVLRPGTNKTVTIKIFIDGKVVDQTNAGADVKNGMVTVDSDRLYNLIDLQGSTQNHLLHIEFQTPGTEVFAFTFG